MLKYIKDGLEMGGIWIVSSLIELKTFRLSFLLPLGLTLALASGFPLYIALCIYKDLLHEIIF